MQFSEFQLLVVLSSELNMRKASERLFVTQPALSQRLQSIEKAWNTKIFIRSQKGLTPTPAGEKIIDFAKEVVEKEEKIREQLQGLNQEVHGTLKIACASIIGQNWLPKVLKKYVNKYPHAKISLITGWSSEILKNLYDDTVHIGIIRGKPDWKGAKHHLLTDTMYMVDTEIQKIEQVWETDRPFIQFKSDSTYYQEIQEWWHRTFQSTPRRTIVVDQIETCKQMTLNGIGYAILPSVTLNDDETKNIYKIPLMNENNEPMKRDTWLVGYDYAFELKQVQAFVEMIKENIDSL
ncbi:LysR family transcriptional regulator [Fredinandcohnia onubensis]|uniref:LysR family transcriptional regulator n=1 Tax=Fredinandcohnia onubensis TaxID=1571209 RepID=UPI000C0BC22B|nr:LysR family transcriptional regulator [Fredinandcohnia onubensis]